MRDPFARLNWLAIPRRRSAPAATSPRHPVRTRILIAAALLLASTGIAAGIAYQLAPTLLALTLGTRRGEYTVEVERGARMTTSDGVDLVSDIYHLLRAPATPTILVRIPFSKTLASRLMATIVGKYWAERGYTVVIQGTRGRYKSGGRYQPLVHERRDGLETLAWLKGQPWFDGRLGMWGGSAFGHTQWAIADAAPAPPLGRSAFMVQICSTDFHGMFYPGGAFSLASALFWAVRSRSTDDDAPADAVLERGYDGFPLIEADDRAAEDIPFFNDWVNHPEKDAYWRAIDGDDRASTLQGPVLLAAGWFDPFLPGQLDDFVRIRRRARSDVASGTRLIVGPWEHAAPALLPDGPAPRNYRLE